MQSTLLDKFMPEQTVSKSSSSLEGLDELPIDQLPLDHLADFVLTADDTGEESHAPRRNVTRKLKARSILKGSQQTAQPDRLSYKFQRLRERLREAISIGTLSGKLPGERTLAQRFHVNAKTLSKALTDLAAEGLLQRTVGRGTFVRAHLEANITNSPETGNILILAPEESAGDSIARKHPLVDAFVRRSAELSQRRLQPGSESEPALSSVPGIVFANDVSNLRPSFLAKFQAFVDIGGTAPEASIRDILLRGIKVILVDRLPRPFVCHSVLFEHVVPTTYLIKRLAAVGHQSIALAFAEVHSDVIDSVQWTIGQILPGVALTILSTEDQNHDELIDNLKSGKHACTAVVFSDFVVAGRFVDAAEKSGIDVPGRLSVASIGLGCTEPPIADTTPDREVTGYAVRPGRVVDAIMELARTPMPVRPLPTWLVSTFCDRGTIGPVPS